MDPNSEFCEDTLSEQNQAPGSGDGGSFDCNICLELAQDPVVTLCGHLFCWPCLYRWLQGHSISKECPVCKGCVLEENVIPLYGRGKMGSADPRTKSVPGMSIPHRPAGKRPDTARAADNHYQSQGFNFMPGQGHVPVGSSGLFPSLFGFQTQNLGAFAYGSAGMPTGFHGGYQQPVRQDQQEGTFLSRLLLFVACFVVLCLLFF